MNQLTKNSSQEELKNYFAGVLALSKREDPFPVDLDDVWPLVYGRKEEAVRALRNSDLFFEGEDYVSEKEKIIFSKKKLNFMKIYRYIITVFFLYPRVDKHVNMDLNKS